MRKCALLLIVLHCCACSSPNKKENTAGLLATDLSNVSKVTQLQLREMLRDFEDRFRFTIKLAANEIVNSTTDRILRKRTVYWKLVTIPASRASIYKQAPIAGLIDMWSFCMQLRLYFESGDGRELFDEWTKIAVSASRELETDISGLAESMMPEEIFERAESTVIKFVEDNPIRGAFGRYSARAALVKASDAKSLQWVMDMPLRPFRMFMDDTAKAIRQFTEVADSFAVFIEAAPEMLRWHLDLLLYDLEGRETMKSAIASFTSMSESAESMTTLVEKLPDEVQSRITATFDDLETQQTAIQKTLQEAQTTLDKLNDSMTGAEKLTASVERTTENWLEAGQEWEKAVTAFDEMIKGFSSDEESPEGKPAPQEEEEGGFDIKDYTATAARAEAAVTEARALTKEFRDFLDSETIETKSWQLVWSGATLIGIFFGALLLYRVASSRLVRKKIQPAP